MKIIVGSKYQLKSTILSFWTKFALYAGNHIFCISFTSNRTNIGTVNFKNITVLQISYKSVTNNLETLSEYKKCERRRKGIPIRFTKINIKRYSGML